MNQIAEDAITGMLNCFPQTSQNYEALLGSLDRLCDGLSDQAIIEAAERFASGDVQEQSKKFAPSSAEFIEEVRRRQDYLSIKARPRIAAPTYTRGPMAPFEIKRQKALNEHAHRPVLLESVGYDDWRRLSGMKQVPTGAIWVASLGIVYGPEPTRKAA